MNTENWRWPESRGTLPGVEFSESSIVAAGIDVGSVSSQAAVTCDGKLYAYSNIRTGADSGASAQRAVDEALKGTGITLRNIQYVVSTGYGRANVSFMSEQINEVACQARGAKYLYGDTIRSVAVMGGQDCKVIKCDGSGKVITFTMNDRCATGAGRGMEIFADMVSVPIQDIGTYSLDVDEDPEPVSSTCYIFGNSEAVNLMRTGLSKNKILAAYCYGIAHRIYTLLMRIDPENELAVTGGLAKNSGITDRLQRLSGLHLPPAKHDPQIAGAVGAAMLAAEKVMAGR